MISIAKKSVISAVTMLALSFLQRGLGFISTVILARLLTPEDYGIIAIIYLVVFLADALSNLGGAQYIIHKAKIDDDDLNTAWTINIILKSTFYLIAALAIPFILHFLEMPDLLIPMLVTLLILPISSITNPGEYLFHKNLELRSFFWMNLIARVSVFIITVILAYVYKNYWALIFGTLFSYLLPALGTYFIHDYRPRLSLIRFNQQWRFSKWVFYNSFIGYIKAQIDVMFISKFFQPADIGGYNMMKNLARMPDRIIISPLASTFLSTYSKVKHDRDKLNKVANVSVLALCSLLCPLAVFFFFNSIAITQILLGEKWLEYTDVFRVLVLSLILTPMAVFTKNYTMAFGSVKSFFYLDLFTVFVSCTVYLFVIGHSIIYFAIGYLFISALQTLIVLFYFKKEVGIPVLFPVTNLLVIVFLSFACGWLFFNEKNTSVGIIDLIFLSPYFIFTYLLLALFIIVFRRSNPTYEYLYETISTMLLDKIKTIKYRT
tara:strand:- start:95 stop:1567 length:1473 start_codon:yes stop_codon:yes gene_type:complete